MVIDLYEPVPSQAWVTSRPPLVAGLFSAGGPVTTLEFFTVEFVAKIAQCNDDKILAE